MKPSKKLCLTIAMALLTGLASASTEPNVHSLLENSDRARGGGNSGMVWDVDVKNSGGTGQDQDMRMRIKATDTASLAETLEPVRSKGAKMLQVDRNMWLTKPGLKKPIPISARQRLTGLAAIGDIAATNYVKDYTPVLTRSDAYKGEPCYVIELTARERQATYDKIVYWVSAERGVAVHANFLSLAGKKLKSADFEYNNSIVVGGKKTLFVSRMEISDELTDARTVLEYGRVRLQTIPESEFDVSHLE